MRKTPEPYTGAALCDYGCGRQAHYKFTTTNKLCCGKRCPYFSTHRGGYRRPIPYGGSELCAYGCGRQAAYVQLDGRTICDSHPRKCPAVVIGRAKRMKEKFGYESPMHDPAFQKRLQTMSVERFGVATPFERREVQDRARSTCKKIYGVENPFAAEVVKEKIKTTNLERFGVENPSSNEQVKQKKVRAAQVKFGVDNPHQSPAVIDKARRTNVEKYGAPHPMQNRAVAYKSLKSGLQRRQFVLPSGKIVYLSGYEPYVLDELLRTGLHEDDFDFSLSQFPVFSFINENGKTSRYTPDFFVPRLNWVIEVKSTYTFQLEKAKNLAKFKAIRDAGYRMNFIVRRTRGKLLLLKELPRPSGSLPQYNPNAIPSPESN